MIPLQTQEEFEKLYRQDALEAPILIYFTATWCRACKKLDWESIQSEFPGLTIYKCDIDENSYTPGYCNVSSIPHMLMMHPSKELESVTTSDTAKAKEFIRLQLENVKLQKQPTPQG
jgi:thioredoxin-like negative regulator of GroEL